MNKNIFKKILINNQIKAEKVRVIKENGEQLGVLSLQEALELAKQNNTDLVLITDNIQPPVCKLINYGKFIYNLQKKEKKKKDSGQIKNIRIGFNIASHDLETKIKAIENFLKKGNKIKIELKLSGRENRFTEIAKEKINEILNNLKNNFDIKIERDLKKEGNRITVLISKK
ncbi:MAG: translation initiation factor IF-3 [Minisyncoccia bacterium]